MPTAYLQEAVHVIKTTIFAFLQLATRTAIHQMKTMYLLGKDLRYVLEIYNKSTLFTNSLPVSSPSISTANSLNAS